MFTFLATLAVENREYLGSFQKKISKIFFQMSAQVYSVPAQTEGRRKAFLEWKSIDSSYELSVTCGIMLTIIKVFIILFLLVRIGNILATFKINH